MQKRLAVPILLLFISPFIQGMITVASADLIGIDEYNNTIQKIEGKKNDQSKRKEVIREKYDTYIKKMKEPILIWGIGYQETIAVEMKGRLKLDLGKKNRVDNFWTNVTISKNLELGLDYNLAKKSHLPSYYLFLPGAGLGVDLTGQISPYAYVSVGGAYFINRKFGIGIKYRKKLSEFEKFGADGVGLFLEYRM